MFHLCHRCVCDSPRVCVAVQTEKLEETEGQHRLSSFSIVSGSKTFIQTCPTAASCSVKDANARQEANASANVTGEPVAGTSEGAASVINAGCQRWIRLSISHLLWFSCR